MTGEEAMALRPCTPVDVLLNESDDEPWSCAVCDVRQIRRGDLGRSNPEGVDTFVYVSYQGTAGWFPAERVRLS